MRQVRYMICLQRICWKRSIYHTLELSNKNLHPMTKLNQIFHRFELIVSITGSSRSTGQMTQSRTSYLPKEIMWGNRFVNVIVYNRSSHVYEVDYNKFDEVTQVGVIVNFVYNSFLFFYKFALLTD